MTVSNEHHPVYQAGWRQSSILQYWATNVETMESVTPAAFFNEHPDWTQRLNGKFSASPVAADGKIYFQNETGQGTVIKAGKTFEQLATNDLNERTQASIAPSNGCLFIRTEKNLYCIKKAG